MCRRHSCSHDEDPRLGFYRQMQSAAKMVLVLVMLGLFLNHGFFKLARIAFFISAIFLGIRYLKVIGLPGTEGWLSDDWKAWTEERYRRNDREEGRTIDIDDKDIV